MIDGNSAAFLTRTRKSSLYKNLKIYSMKYANRYAIILLLLFLFYYVINFLNLINFNEHPPADEMLDGFNTLKLKIDYLQSVVDNKQKDINNLKEAFALNVKYYNDLVEKQKLVLNKLKDNLMLVYDASQNGTSHNNRVGMENNLDEMKLILSKMNLHNITKYSSALFKTLANIDVEFPQMNDFLPHLNSSALAAIQPKFKLSKNRFASIVIGIPTIKRDKTSYLLETLKSLLDAMNDLEKTEALIVVFIPELEDHAFVQNTIESISKIFKFEVDSGLIDIVVPAIEYYPDFTKTQPDRVFNDSIERVKWRTKQNYDFAYLMAYAQRRGQFYLQLEDDVVTKSGYFSTIKDFIKKQKSDRWMVAEFSQLGFIGKLFKTNQLSLFINFFLMFSNDKPVDWLYDIALDVKICNPEKGNEHCERSKSELKIKYKPSLFQHVGMKSSLKGKTQKLKDKDFGKQLIVAHRNPPAKTSTSLKTYMKYTLDGAYLGLNYFWAMAPAPNDFILFEFDKPTVIKKYYIKSGNPEHPDDKLYNATFHIKTVNPIPDAQLPDDYLVTSDNFYIINKFSNELGTVGGILNGNLTGPVSQIRIHIPNASETWIIISEIDFSS